MHAKLHVLLQENIESEISTQEIQHIASTKENSDVKDCCLRFLGPFDVWKSCKFQERGRARLVTTLDEMMIKEHVSLWN